MTRRYRPFCSLACYQPYSDEAAEGYLRNISQMSAVRTTFREPDIHQPLKLTRGWCAVWSRLVWLVRRAFHPRRRKGPRQANFIEPERRQLGDVQDLAGTGF